MTINRLKEKLREYEEKIEDRVQVMYEYQYFGKASKCEILFLTTLGLTFYTKVLFCKGVLGVKYGDQPLILDWGALKITKSSIVNNCSGS